MNMEQQLRGLLDKQAIEEAIKTYARALDRMDEALLRTVFHPGSKHVHFYEGPSSDPSLPSRPGQPLDFVAFAMDVLRTHLRTHHQLGNILIELDGDSAFAETYFTAHHRMRPKGDPLASPTAFDTEMDYFVGGRYIDRFERRDGQWRITHRTGMTDWMRIDAPASQAFGDVPASQIGRQGPDDMIYRCRTLYG
jgi:hypothetical protein